jgi:hypothetical protein
VTDQIKHNGVSPDTGPFTDVTGQPWTQISGASTHDQTIYITRMQSSLLNGF